MMTAKYHAPLRRSLGRPFASLLVLAALGMPGTVFSMNNDALPDLVFANQANFPNTVCLQDGLLGLLCDVANSRRRMDFGVALGDMDEDGNLDAVFKTQGSPDQLCFGDGMGSFQECRDASAAVDDLPFGGVVLNDFNGDLHLDAAFANAGIPSQVCFGNGRGRLDDCSDISPDLGSARALALGDVNNDSVLDLVFAAFSGPDIVCLGGGGGAFSCSNLNEISDRSTGIALGDLNNDGDLDAVISNENQPNLVCLGDGAGSFSCNITNEDTNRTMGVALADINEDGNLDAVFANDFDQVNQVCFGDGFGFLANCSDLTAGNSTSVVLDDLNADGHQDAVFTQTFQPDLLCVGDGSGALDCSDIPGSENFTGSAAAVSRLGPYCSSPVRDLVDLEREVMDLDTSTHTMNTLDSRLERIGTWLARGELDRAREHVDDFITQAIRVADPNNTKASNLIARAESDSLVCGASNLLDNISGDVE